MNEGGQSSTGQLLDFMIDTHPASAKLKALAKEKGTNHFSLLTDILNDLAKERGAPFLSYLTKDYYLYPDLHGSSFTPRSLVLYSRGLNAQETGPHSPTTACEEC